MKQPIDKRRLLLLLPLPILALAAGLFFTLGGGKARPETGQPAGINQNLPDANLKNTRELDKMGIYRQAEQDSARSASAQGSFRATGFEPAEQKAQALEISQKLQALQKHLEEPEPPAAVPNKTATGPASTRPAADPQLKADVDRLEKLMKAMQEPKAEDPEVSQLSSMLDKIITIQNPGLAQQGQAQASPAGDSLFKTIPATIAGKQRVKQDATVKLRLEDSVRLSGILVPKGHELYGSCKLAAHRLLIQVSNIRLGNRIIPVSLSVYSLDGMPGIDAPQAELSQAAGGGAADALQGMHLLSMDQSLALQAAGAGIDAARGLLSKKVRKIRVPLKAGQQVLLRNNQAKSK